MRITMKQLAEKAGVHRSTVDKVLHNRPGVSEPVRARVRAVIEEYGYQPNEAGIALRMQEKTFRIAVVLMDVDSTPYNRNGIERGLSAYQAYNIRTDYHIFGFSAPQKILELLRDIERNRSADGVILVPQRAESLTKAVNALKRSGVPTVLVNADLPDSEALRYIGANNRQSSRLAGRLMGALTGGRGEIAVITSAIQSENNNASVEERERSFREFITTTYPDLRIAATVENMESSEITYEKTLHLLRDYPGLRGIYSTCGGAYKIGEAVEELGLSGKIVVITHELYPEIMRLIERGTITCTIGSELNNQGFLAAKTLMDALIFKKQPENRTLYTKSEIIFRENADAAEP